MAEAPNGRITLERPAGTAPSTAAMKAAIRETRYRLAAQVAQTADHVHLLFTTPSASVKTEAPVGGVVAGAIKAIAVAGRTRRVWTDARRTGLLRRAAIGGVIAGHRGSARGEDTTSLTRRIEQPEGNDMAKKAQKRAGAKRARPAGKRDLVRGPESQRVRQAHRARSFQRNG